jgi:hypothetical protein
MLKNKSRKMSAENKQQTKLQAYFFLGNSSTLKMEEIYFSETSDGFQ